MKAEIAQNDTVHISMTRNEANQVYYALTELGARLDEQKVVRDIWAFFDSLHRIPIEGSVDVSPPKPKPRRR